MEKIKTILVEDEPLSLQYASSLLSTCAGITLSGTANTQDKAVELICELNPDLVLLDVELHGGNGFEVLKRTAGNNYNVVFTTALFEEALYIIILSGVPILQKPLDYDELKKNLENFADPAYIAIQNNCLETLRRTLHNNHLPLTIALNCDETLHHIALQEIIKIVAEEGKIYFFLENGKIMHPPNDIKYYEMLLAGFGFFRVNVNTLVNLSFVNRDSFIGDSAQLSNGSHVILSPKKKQGFLDALKKYLTSGPSSKG